MNGDCLIWRNLSLSKVGLGLKREGTGFLLFLSIWCGFMRIRGWLCGISLFLCGIVDFWIHLLILWKCQLKLIQHIWYLFYRSFWLEDRLLNRSRNWCFWGLMFRMLLLCLVCQVSSCEWTQYHLTICLALVREWKFFGFGIG